MSFSVRQLRYFVAVAESGQVSGAARELFVSQSSVTAAVQQIEQRLKAPVFHRSARGVALTPTGRALLPKARQILQLLEEAEGVTPADLTVSGTLRVGVSYTVMGYFLPHHVQQLAVLYPGLKVEWSEMDRQPIEDRVVAGDLDFGLLLTSNLADDSQLQYETFVHSRRRLWMAPTHPLAGREGVRLADVEQYPYALLTVDEAAVTTRSYWQERPMNVLIKTSSIEAIRSVVANGNAVTILSDMVYRPWSLEGRRIDTTLLADPVPDMRIGLTWDRGREFTPAMVALHDYFYRIFLTPALG
ncbi:LysR family transcriptional regulator [Tsukamurella spumae]|uniref:LysR family transcriptional regulator n=1 Tax=Tsukamurella spumae TaxID=44753 RepID=A0A846X7L7_9ACTN|nr:LysR family transcriptional regulator [Tsukamurella spumae]NKY19750.1 LysR family transcriptional regulator [Tsukamurella spumae]